VKTIFILLGKSENWKHWLTMNDDKVCKPLLGTLGVGLTCKEKHGQIYPINGVVNPAPPLHPNCRCIIEIMDAMVAGMATNNGENGADYYIVHTGKLPNYYITSIDAASNYGYKKGKNTIGGKASGKMLGGDVYKNKDGHLPDALGRIWYEADINYIGGKRNNERIVYSNDGLIFVTYDHYYTFYEIIKTSDTDEEGEE